MTGVGFEPTTYGLKVLPGLEPARFFQDNTGQHVHHLGALVRAHMGLVPLWLPLPWKRAERQRSDTVSWGPQRLRGQNSIGMIGLIRSQIQALSCLDNLVVTAVGPAALRMLPSPDVAT